MSFIATAERVAREGWRSYRVARETMSAYASVTGLVASIKIGGVTTLVAAVIGPAGVVLALLLVPLWPWIWLLPVLAFVVAIAAGVVTAWLAAKVLPERLRALAEKTFDAAEHAIERKEQVLAALEEYRVARGRSALTGA